MHIKDLIKNKAAAYLASSYEQDIKPTDVLVNLTKKEFEGDYTIVVFPFVKRLKKNPAELGNELGQAMVDACEEFSGYNLIKGFLNLELSHDCWRQTLKSYQSADDLTRLPSNGKKVMVEFSSPNTNKPLHLGHIRNILLGWSSSQLLEAAGYDVIKTQIINDRGIAVCKSMLAWQKFGEGATPESTGIKGDHFVGSYYVLFEKKFQAEYKIWQESDEAKAILAKKQKEGQDEAAFWKAYKNQYFNEYSQLGLTAKEMLRQWEAGEEQTVALWKKMNGWVYDGFNVTYDALGVSFDKLYYESDTYLLGKEVVQKGLASNTFYQKDDGSAWVDLEPHGMDQKILLRSDGTAVYMTQDIGTAMMRYADFGVEQMVYVVGDEQNYHFKVLFTILGMLDEPYADGLHHLSYGMVDLPDGKMKSREGTVVDADDLVAEVIEEARKTAADRGEIAEMNTEDQNEVLRKIGLGALKYFIIKVQPQRRMTFDPSSSVDMQGQTGPYIQNAYVRIQSILRKTDLTSLVSYDAYTELNPLEVGLLRSIGEYKEVLSTAADQLDPSLMANYCYELAKDYHRFYHDVRILSAETEEAKSFRLHLSNTVAKILEAGMGLLGIEMPEKM